MEDRKIKKHERRSKGEGSVFKSNGYWYVTYGYTVAGQQRKKKKCLGPVEDFESESEVRTEALKFRNLFVAEVTNGNVTRSDAGSVKCGELLTQYVKQLKLKKKPSAYVIEKCIEANIRPFFGPVKVMDLSESHFERYRTKRVEADGVSDSTVDHDLNYLKSALMLEHRKKPHTRVPVVPTIPRSGLDNVRQGFLDLEGYEKVLKHLPVSLRCLFVVAYHIGSRKSALLGLKWDQIDLGDRLIRFVRKEHGKPVAVYAPIYGDMHEWIAHQRAYRDRNFPECEAVFFWYPADCEIRPRAESSRGGRRNEPGTPLRDFRGSWKQAVADAGYPSLLFHDLRRSAVRNMVEKMGWSEKKAMTISGHKTDAMLKRYDIIPVADIQESGRDGDEWWKSQRQKHVTGDTNGNDVP